MLIAHGTLSSANARPELTLRGTKDGDVRLLRAYAQRGWLAVYVLRRGYGQSDGPIPVAVTKCNGSSPTVQEFSDADADDLEATLAYIGQREDADTSRIMTLGVSGGGLAVVALGARNTPGLKVIVNISGALRSTACSDAQNSERLVKTMQHYGTKSKVPNLWYYAEMDQYAPGPTVDEMRSAFLEGGG
jgi:dienelactone hydrolase